MLVLSRRIGESITLSGGIVIQVQRFRGHQVQIGIDAPTDVIVLREEVHVATQLGRETTRADLDL